MSNLKLGVKQALIATLIESGISPSSAAEYITDTKIDAGVAYIHARLNETAHIKDEEERWGQAFQALKHWVPGNV